MPDPTDKSLPKGTVFIVDDDPSIRRSLARLITSFNLHPVAFESADAFLRSDLTVFPPACMVLDIRMPGIDGMQLQERLSEKETLLPIIFLTGHGEVAQSVKGMRHGAVNFLTKPCDEQDLLASVQEALAKSLRESASRSEQERVKALVDTLTPREHEIFTRVITGTLNKQIAYALDISEKTVKVHRARVMEKLKADSLVDLVRLAATAGIDPANPTEP